jgi:hypothetical protein
MYSTKQAFWDFRPLSEYFYEQAEGRKDFRFLFYCRTCVKNFDAPIRVRKCKFCHEENIVELPKFVWKRKELFKKAIARESFRKMLQKAAAKLREEKAAEHFDFATRLRLAMIYYFGLPAGPAEEGAEGMSQSDLLASFRLV